MGTYHISLPANKIHHGKHITFNRFFLSFFEKFTDLRNHECMCIEETGEAETANKFGRARREKLEFARGRKLNKHRIFRWIVSYRSIRSDGFHRVTCTCATWSEYMTMHEGGVWPSHNLPTSMHSIVYSFWLQHTFKLLHTRAQFAPQ